MHTPKFLYCILFLFYCIIFSAQEESIDKKVENEDSDKEKKIEKILENSVLKEGILQLYEDTLNGKVRMLIRNQDLNKEFIYFSQINNGTTRYRLNRGRYMDSFVFEFQKQYNRVQVIRKNLGYYFDPQSNLYKAKDANINHPVLAAIKIESQNHENNEYLIDVSSLFLNEIFLQIKPSDTKNNDNGVFKLGSIDKDKSTLVALKNYPDNLNIKTQWVYSQKSSSNNGGQDIIDARNISIEVFHSIISMPDNDFQARRDDPRVGYFTHQADDQTTEEVVYYKDIIKRWNLVKRDPNAALSEPVEPIVWWIENTTPEKFRATIKQGVLKWNKAFEKAGFRNAIQVKTQADDATWDAGDIHYNVLRWTSSPNPPFGGYGPSFSNPRTGEIIGADIMLEYIHHTNRVFYSKLYDEVAQNSIDDSNDFMYCSAGHVMHQQMQLARALADVQALDDQEWDKLQEEAMLELIMHEIGHTLGLTHNMKASFLYSPEQLYDKNFAKDRALAGSIMDYIEINLNPNPDQQGSYYSTEVGPYDLWAIQYGYTPNLSEEELKQIASQSNKAEYIYGNDADDMRSSSRGMDPRVMIDDHSNDPLRYMEDRMVLIRSSYDKVADQLLKEGAFYEDYRRGLATLMSSYWRANTVISRWIGGVYINRSVVGQKGKQDTYIPVEYDKQKKAMKLLAEYAFSPIAWDIDGELFKNYAHQRRGFDAFQGADDIKIHEIILTYQDRVLHHLLHNNTIDRIVNTSQYGNKYSLMEMLNDLTEAIFKDKIQADISTFEQNLQSLYTHRLIEQMHKNNNFVAKNAFLAQLLSIQKHCKNKSGSALSKAHKLRLKAEIKKGIVKK